MKQTVFNAFKKTKYKFEENFSFLKNIFLKINYSIGTNIGAYFIHGFKDKIKYNKFLNYKCNIFSCITCKFLKETSSIKLNNIVLPILSNNNFDSSGIIYVISCKKCNRVYVGESKRKTKKRFLEHYKNISKFKYNIIESISNFNNKSEIPIHFNSSKHCLKTDLELYVVINNLNDDQVRKSKETDLMHVFKALKIRLLNRKIPEQKYISQLFFYNN